ncbi:hypothetical protein CDAR_390221 [Caerostris darwini]|uniref:Uncharacterized protein n=1 Tax=Caerostris darwini TaxID=1538125 RepID=A0AAV4NZ06_9ARAC|nr:hypothetical protein CDAR_390221 [Caerostris darwini]
MQSKHATPREALEEKMVIMEAGGRGVGWQGCSRSGIKGIPIPTSNRRSVRVHLLGRFVDRRLETPLTKSFSTLHEQSETDNNTCFLPLEKKSVEEEVVVALEQQKLHREALLLQGC